MDAYPLLRAYPRLAARLPVAGLLAGPTPVAPLDTGVHVKHDDLSARDYGGNKVRKLDFLLADAKARGAREVLTFGYAGSNFVAATAWHGRKLGLRTLAYLLPQLPHDYAATNLAVGLASDAELHVLPNAAVIGVAAVARSAGAVLRRGRAPAWIPPGGSSPKGIAGFVNAAFELKAQVDAGEVPEPDVVYVPLSSMGTVAGLALGFELARLRARIEAIQVATGQYASWPKLEDLVRQTDAWLRAIEPGLPAGRPLERVRIRPEFLGPGYARPIPEAAAAMKRFSTAGGGRADPTYTGKALAALYHDLGMGRLRGKSALYWHTLSARALPDGVARPPAADVPAALRPYFA